MPVNVAVKTKIEIDGKEYASVDEVPADKREAIARALEATPPTIVVNGETHPGAADLAPSLKGLVESALAAAKHAPVLEEPESEPLRAEPVVSIRTIVIATGVILVLGLIARFLF